MKQRVLLYTGSQKGFTLIELLVVVAIIGILASIVLVSLGNSRAKGSDAAIKANLSTIRGQAELYALMNGNSYGVFNGGSLPPLAGSTSLCLSQTSGNMFADSTIKGAITSAQKISGSVIRCFTDGNTWAVSVALKTNVTVSWCVGSLGKAVEINTVNALLAGNTCLQ